MPLITQGKTNWKFLLIVVILAVIVGGGILSYYYLWIRDTETRLAELELGLPAAKTLPAGIATKAHFIYLTEKQYDGKLGGRFGADEKCSIPPGLSCKSETTHALITVNDNDSIINMAEKYGFNKNLPIYWYNKETNKKTILANNWLKMIGEDIINDQGVGTGREEWPDDFPWTGGPGDHPDLQTCDQWTTNEGDLGSGAGSHGEIGGIDKTFWLESDGWAGKWSSTSCVNKRYLRCICEGNVTQ